MADSFIRLTLTDGSTHNVLNADPSLLDAAAKGQRWADEWIEVEGGGAVTRRLVSSNQVVQIELFER